MAFACTSGAMVIGDEKIAARVHEERPLDRGIEVPVMGSFNHENDNEVARIDARSVEDAVLELGRYPSVDAVFVSCTSLRAAERIEALEAKLGKPVTSSNHALAWHSLRLAGYAAPLPGFGRLMRLMRLA